MNNIVRAFIVLIALALVCPALGQADIVYLKSEDRLYGSIQNPSFTIRAPYGKVLVRTASLKSIVYKNGSIEPWIIQTINNDRFSGTLIDNNIRFKQEDGNQKTIKSEQIKRMKREIKGPSQRITTTIFTMKNGDRFSGTFLHDHLEIRTNYTTRSIQAAEINRIEFMQDNQANLKVLLKNGDLLEGTSKQNQFHLMPGAGSELNVIKSDLNSIQFNAPKLVLQESSGSLQAENDSDGDSIPDCADTCRNTPRGVTVEQDGCTRKLAMAESSTEKEISSQSNHKAADINSPSHVVGDIQFDFDRFELKTQYLSILDEVAVMALQNPKIKLKIQGHADDIGAEEYNQILSEKRANRVKNYFVRKGIDQSRLFPVGFGAKMNKASNKTEAGRALNRRVELIAQN